MEKDGVLHDRESQAGASGLTAASLAYPVETFEDTVQVVFVDASPRVVIGEIIEFVVFRVIVDPDRDVFSGIVDRVFDEITEYGVHESLVSLDRDCRIDAIFDGDAMRYDRLM